MFARIQGESRLPAEWATLYTYTESCAGMFLLMLKFSHKINRVDFSDVRPVR
jgi:hypothetical protein